MRIREILMKRIGYFTVILSLSMNMAALAEEKVVLLENEFGGMTEIYTYSKEDVEHKRGFHKKTISYDHKNDIKSVEILATKAHTKAEGWHTSITYFWGERRIGELYPTDSHAQEYGFNKMVVYYDEDNKVSKREYFLRDNTIGAKQGIYKRVVYYDTNEKRIKSENLDKLGNVVKTEMESGR